MQKGDRSMGFNIAIDGPAGAGKSTVARRAAAELGFDLCGHGGDVPHDRAGAEAPRHGHIG